MPGVLSVSKSPVCPVPDAGIILFHLTAQYLNETHGSSSHEKGSGMAPAQVSLGWHSQAWGPKGRGLTQTTNYPVLPMAQSKLLHPGELAFVVIPKRLKCGNRGTGIGIKPALVEMGERGEGTVSVTEQKPAPDPQVMHRGFTWGNFKLDAEIEKAFKPQRDKTHLMQPLCFEVLCKGEVIKRPNTQSQQICRTGDGKKSYL